MWRINADILLLVSVYALPWWLTASLLLIGMFTFRFWWEGVWAALMMDLLYAPSQLAYRAYNFTLASLVLLVLVHVLARRFIRAYES